ncbi:MAG: heavy metal-associated domain-containing protein [Chitinophagaceae bacterium]
MKFLKILVSLLLISGFSFAQSFRNIELQAAGLTCSMCSNAVNKALKQIDFIQDIKTDLDKNLFVISIKPGAEPDFDLIRKKVEAAGFSVGKMDVEVNFTNQKIANDEHAVVGGKALHFLNVKPQTLNGWKKVQLVDKSFLVASQAKKWANATTMACYKTGVAGTCCTDPAIKPGQRMYHVTI